MTLPLFAECALPGCVNPADEAGGPCPECTSLFDGAAGGWTIRRSEGGASETAEQVVDRKTEQRIAQALATTPERKPNQVCWLCEERRTCTKEPGGWECDSCRACG